MFLTHLYFDCKIEPKSTTVVQTVIITNYFFPQATEYTAFLLWISVSLLDSLMSD